MTRLTCRTCLFGSALANLVLTETIKAQVVVLDKLLFLLSGLLLVGVTEHNVMFLVTQ